MEDVGSNSIGESDFFSEFSLHLISCCCRFILNTHFVNKPSKHNPFNNCSSCSMIVVFHIEIPSVEFQIYSGHFAQKFNFSVIFDLNQTVVLTVTIKN